MKSLSSDKTIFKPTNIEPDQLHICDQSDERIKRTYKHIDVECKHINLSEDVEIRTYLAILGKLGICPYILKFYGLSKIEENDVQVLGWAELKSLKDFYDKHDIGWETKVSLTRDICRGIAFLNSMNVYHHDIRCENIMLTKFYEPKIANFDVAREFNEKSKEIPDLKVLRWMHLKKWKENLIIRNVKFSVLE